MEILLVALSAVCGYLLGSVSMAVLLTKLKYSKDVRSEGSGNAGATNVARVYGMSAGLLTLGGDVLKTLFGIFIGWLLAGEYGLTAAAFGAVLGHCFPVYFGFKGGKGISVTLAVAMCLDWRMALISLAIFIIVVLLTRYVSLGSIVAVISVPVVFVLLNGAAMPKLAVAIFLPVIVWYMHRANIKRLLNGTESKFVPKK